MYDSTKSIVYISNEAFLTLLFSSIEPFPSKYEYKRKPRNSPEEGEAFGLLFGSKVCRENANIYNVSFVETIQMVRRTQDWVQWSKKHCNRVKELLEALPMFEYLGTFHSHPWRKTEYKPSLAALPSKEDVDSTKSDSIENQKEVLDIILAITALTKKPKRDSKRHDSWVEGYVGKYKYKLNAYIGDGSGVLPVDRLICPMATGISNKDLV